MESLRLRLLDDIGMVKKVTISKYCLTFVLSDHSMPSFYHFNLADAQTGWGGAVSTRQKWLYWVMSTMTKSLGIPWFLPT
jgi:hypothetical protein